MRERETESERAREALVVDQANLNAKQESVSGVNYWLAADCLFSRGTQRGGQKIDVRVSVCVCVCWGCGGGGC